MKFKTFAQLHAERAARRARPKKKIKPKKLVRKLRYTPTGILLGVDLGDKPQAGGPAHKESGSKQQAIQETVPYNDIEEAQS